MYQSLLGRCEALIHGISNLSARFRHALPQCLSADTTRGCERSPLTWAGPAILQESFPIARAKANQSYFEIKSTRNVFLTCIEHPCDGLIPDYDRCVGIEGPAKKVTLDSRSEATAQAWPDLVERGIRRKLRGRLYNARLHQVLPRTEPGAVALPLAKRVLQQRPAIGKEDSSTCCMLAGQATHSLCSIGVVSSYVSNQHHVAE